MSRTLRTPTLLGNQMQDFSARLPSYRGISPYPAPPQETAQYAGDATVPSLRGGTANMSMAPSAPTMSRSRTMAAPMTHGADYDRTTRAVADINYGPGAGAAMYPPGPIPISTMPNPRRTGSAPMMQPASPPVMSPTLRTSIAGREQQADLYAALPSTLPGGGPVSPSALRQRTALVTKLRGIDDRLTAPFVAQPTPEDPRIGVARAEAEGRVGAAKATAEAQANRQQQQQQFQAGESEKQRQFQGQQNVNKQNAPETPLQKAQREQAEARTRATTQPSPDQAAITERERMREEARAQTAGAPSFEHYLMAVMNDPAFKTAGAEKQIEKAREIWKKFSTEPPGAQGTAPRTQANAGPRTYKHTATGPNGEKVGSNDGVNWEPIQ